MSEIVLTFLINAAWQSTVIAIVALIACRSRHALLATALVMCVAIPALSLIPRDAPAALTVAVPERVNPIAIAYLIGLAIAAALLLVRLFRAALLLRQAEGGRADVALPVTIGRTIILPRTLTDPRLVEAALAHESAHVARHDYAIHVALEVLTLPLYFHPAVARLRKAVNETREIACDEAAAAACDGYAQSLVRIAAMSQQSPAVVMAMATSSIERRVAQLIQPRRDRLPAFVAIVLVLLAGIACARSPLCPEAPLNGVWTIDNAASSIKYNEFVTHIVQSNRGIAMQQRRVKGNRVMNTRVSIITDGVPRPISRNVVARAWWRDGGLRLEVAGPGANRESASAFVRSDRLIVNGKTNRGTYHTEFRRAQ